MDKDIVQYNANLQEANKLMSQLPDCDKSLFKSRSTPENLWELKIDGDTKVKNANVTTAEQMLEMKGLPRTQENFNTVLGEVEAKKPSTKLYLQRYNKERKEQDVIEIDQETIDYLIIFKCLTERQCRSIDKKTRAGCRAIDGVQIYVPTLPGITTGASCNECAMKSKPKDELKRANINRSFYFYVLSAISIKGKVTPVLFKRTYNQFKKLREQLSPKTALPITRLGLDFKWEKVNDTQYVYAYATAKSIIKETDADWLTQIVPAYHDHILPIYEYFIDRGNYVSNIRVVEDNKESAVDVTETVVYAIETSPEKAAPEEDVIPEEFKE